MSVEVRLKASYSLVRFLIKLINYHIEILKQEQETKARKVEEILTELEGYRNLRMQLLLYLGKVTENVEMNFDAEDVILLDKICYLYFVVTKKVMKVDKNIIIRELEKFYAQIKEWVMVVQCEVSEYLN